MNKSDELRVSIFERNIIVKGRAIMGWYGRIEEPVRELVRLLRDNGFNTTSSCGHKMTVEMEWYGFEEEARTLYNLLSDNSYNQFEIRLLWPSSGIGRFMEIKLL